LKKQWTASTLVDKIEVIGGTLCGAAAVVLFAPPSSFTWTTYLVLIPSITAVAHGWVMSERRAFADHFKAFGRFVYSEPGEPSRLRYLQFLDKIEETEGLTHVELQLMIPAFEAKLGYRESFFRQHPAIAVLSALIAILIASGLGQSAVWTSGWGPPALISLAAFWPFALWSSRRWQELRPSRDAAERELLSFMHYAAVDLRE